MHFTELDRTLLRALLAFRVIALAWMGALVAVAIASEPDVDPVVAGLSFVLAGLATAFAIRAVSRDPRLLRNRWFLGVDGLVALGVALSPWLAGTGGAFYGGYPMAWMLLVAFATSLWWGLGAAVGVVVLQVAVALGTGLLDASGLTRSGITMLVTVGVIGWGFRLLRDADRARAESEAALVEERERTIRLEERGRLATALHDSAVQTLVVLRQQADDPDRVRVLARRQERELRRVIQGTDATAPTLRAALEAIADDIEDLHAVAIDRVFVGDHPGASEEGIGAVREALTNAAKHSGARTLHLYVEVGDDVTALVRDRGEGFDPDHAPSGRGVDTSIRARLESVGGSVHLRSEAGAGTDVEMRWPT
ncbi:MAG: hypothetical protein JSV07_02240 [Acidimicrobiia bacterium]|nr:MAG: hypothetical protein JSV07_02240 [Acidimicrobiia bacterium]